MMCKDRSDRRDESPSSIDGRWIALYLSRLIACLFFMIDLDVATLGGSRSLNI